MKKFSPNVTDGELMELFREAAENHEPLYSLRDKEELWERIQSEDRTPYRGGIRKKLLSWLPSMLVLLFLGASLRVGDSLLQMGKVYALPTPEPTWNKDREEFIRERGPALVNKAQGTREAVDHRAEGDWRSRRDGGGGIGRPGEGIQRIGAIQRDELNNRRIARAVEVPVLAEIGRGQPEPTGQWDILAGGRDKQGRAELPGGSRDQRTKVGVPVASRAQGWYKEKGWSIGFTLGTDWSMVKDAGGERAGLDWGVLVEYRFARRWSVESGLSVASKIYSARPKDYHSPAPYPGLVSVDARCRVFDLPINIRYDLLQKGSSRLFASTGLSSFWMQKEDYAYNSDVNGSLYRSKMTIYNQNRYFLSIANFAFGYEYAWNKFSVQASPYLKLPLSGIGYGKVDLISTGILLSVKRRL